MCVGPWNDDWRMCVCATGDHWSYYWSSQSASSSLTSVPPYFIITSLSSAAISKARSSPSERLCQEEEGFYYSGEFNPLPLSLSSASNSQLCKQVQLLNTLQQVAFGPPPFDFRFGCPFENVCFFLAADSILLYIILSYCALRLDNFIFLVATAFNILHGVLHCLFAMSSLFGRSGCASPCWRWRWLCFWRPLCICGGISSFSVLSRRFLLFLPILFLAKKKHTHTHTPRLFHPPYHLFPPLPFSPNSSFFRPF